MSEVSLPDEVRAACGWVAARARFVQIEESRIHRYALDLANEGEVSVAKPTVAPEPEEAAAFAICMNAINFGSGWWPTIRKRPGHSGYATIAASVEDRFASAGPWRVEELLAMDAVAISAVAGQKAEHPLMEQFAAALRDVGTHLHTEHQGRYLAVIDVAESVPDLARRLAGWEAFADVSSYEKREVPFFKRAQLAAADLHRAGLAALPGVERLTAFADNLVPHVLRIDGVLHLDATLSARIGAGKLLAHGSPEEVELRACAIHVVELLAAACGGDLTPAQIDSILWNRGRGERYKSVARPRSRNTAY
ncbi:MAG TPA: queuosine salvage family protein [Solirubrobacterales bacterium]|nr:queuosine salvage family protein [Solirubrobacterales bacterium]